MQAPRAPGRPVAILRVTALPPGFAELAADARADGVRLLEVLREDWAAGTLRFEGPGEALFAAQRGEGLGEALLGVCGVTADPYTAEPGAARLRRLYVLRAARGAGVGRALVGAVAEQARAGGFTRLRVRAPPAAYGFYAACGFLRVVGETAATHVLPLVLPGER